MLWSLPALFIKRSTSAAVNAIADSMQVEPEKWVIYERGTRFERFVCRTPPRATNPYDIVVYLGGKEIHTTYKDIWHMSLYDYCALYNASKYIRRWWKKRDKHLAETYLFAEINKVSKHNLLPPLRAPLL